MEIEFDTNKNAANIRLRGLSFERVVDFDSENAVYRQDSRRDYGEIRIRTLGFLDGRLHALVFTETAKDVRVISFRKANKREVKTYEQETQS